MIFAIVPKVTHASSKQKRNYTCRICHLTFTTLNEYVNHIKEVHPESNEALATGVSRVDLLEDGSEP